MKMASLIKRQEQPTVAQLAPVWFNIAFNYDTTHALSGGWQT
jgi:hypothetical protein